MSKLQMSLIETIRVRSEMPCTIQSGHLQSSVIQGFTKELTRDAAIVLVCNKPAPAWLKSPAEVIIHVALPVSGNFHPRVLEVAAIVTDTRLQGDLLRVTAAVHRMTFVDRKDTAGNNPTQLSYRR